MRVAIVAWVAVGLLALSAMAQYEGDNYDIRPNDNTCFSLALRLCPKSSHEPMHFSSHVECVLQKRKEFPGHCYSLLTSMQRCIDDMLDFCPDLTHDETMKCLEHHSDQVSFRCKASFLMEHMHVKAGRDISQYEEEYQQDLHLQEEEMKREAAELYSSPSDL